MLLPTFSVAAAAASSSFAAAFMQWARTQTVNTKYSQVKMKWTNIESTISWLLGRFPNIWFFIYLWAEFCSAHTNTLPWTTKHCFRIYSFTSYYHLIVILSLCLFRVSDGDLPSEWPVECGKICDDGKIINSNVIYYYYDTLNGQWRERRKKPDRCLLTGFIAVRLLGVKCAHTQTRRMYICFRAFSMRNSQKWLK